MGRQNSTDIVGGKKKGSQDKPHRWKEGCIAACLAEKWANLFLIIPECSVALLLQLQKE